MRLKTSGMLSVMLASAVLGGSIAFREPTLKLNPNIQNKSSTPTKFDLERIAEAEARRERKRLKKMKK